MRYWLVLAVFVAATLAAEPPPPVAVDAEVSFTQREIRLILKHSPLEPPPPDPTNRVADDPAAARLGQFLFFDERLSGDSTRSCATCHEPQRAFTDGRQLAEGAGPNTRHTQGLYNVAYNRWFFWDGRADTLWGQVVHPIVGPNEMAGSRLGVYRGLLGDLQIRRAYESIFGPPPELQITDERVWAHLSKPQQAKVNRVLANLSKCIAAYERMLVSRSAPFDRFAEGIRENNEAKRQAISPSAQRGLKLFVGKGNCRLCHTGPNFSDGEFHNIGVPPLRHELTLDPGRLRGADLVLEDEFNSRGSFSDAPGGTQAQMLKFLVNGPQNLGAFKTPSLRNAALTSPYMHEGQFDSLERVVKFYSTLEGAIITGHHGERILEPLDLTDQEQSDLVAFLKTLTDVNIAPELLVKPDSPM